MEINRRLVLAARPKGVPEPGDIVVETAPMPVVPDGGYVIRTLFASLDPAIRQRLSQSDSYVAQIPVGGALTSITLGEVIESRDPGLRPGDHIVGFHEIADYAAAVAGPLTRKIDIAATRSPTHHLGVLGMTGLTAYFGMLDICRPAHGDTVLISAAAGAVGSIAAQIARIRGARTVGIAGGAAKCERLINRFGLDHAIDYRGKDLGELTAAIRLAAPGGIHAYFDNVGGRHLDAALATLTDRGRVALCGLISQYNTETPYPFANLFKVVARSLRIEGFIVATYAERFETALAEIGDWLRRGDLRFDEDIVDGLYAAPTAFAGLFDGTNTGKLILKMR